MGGKILSKNRLPEWLLLAAQGLALAALILGLIFVVKTTGGTLFLFSTLAPLLAGLAIAVVAGVAIYRYRNRHRLFSIQRFAPGEIIFHQGDVGDCAYFIHSGEVEVIREHPDRQEMLARLGPDQYFGEMALITEAPRNATIRAATPVRVAVLGKNNFKALLSVLPATKEDILKTVQARAKAAQSLPAA